MFPQDYEIPTEDEQLAGVSEVMLEDVGRDFYPLDENRHYTEAQGRVFTGGTYAGIVAVVTVTGEDTKWPAGPGAIIDWAAYRGTVNDVASEEVGAKHVATQGNKLNETEAMFYFPELRECHYRT